ncbi:hypothetical protein HF086_012097 [Spodoptera exigua]|uniref:Cyclic nucleotide-binding domain-containing protein n=1 Tax=Spodoptera exigua TaxID=7107 RepID=A0A922SCE0_SPOEX|nr:hypothetical protein HF086_012097 [Spodoptera exigua]
MKRKFRAKCRFRAVARMVMANYYWMIEAAEQYEGVEDVKRRVAQAVRGKAKKKRLLAITHVKKKLAAVTYFKYYSPNRVIVRQHHEAHALYFIVTGDVIVSQSVFDELLQQYVQVDIGIMHAGDMFGEVSLLHNIRRTATCTTAGHCELLAVMKEDFKNVLQASVQKQWDEVRRAMSAFTYFDALDEVARREGCIVAKMKSYNTNDIILGDGCGIPNFVYFILSGQCQMIETVQVTVTHRLGHTYYTLYDPFVPKEESEQDIDVKYFNAYKEKVKEMQQLSQELPEVMRASSKRLESIMKFSDVKHHSSSTKKDSLTTSDTTAPSGTADTSSAMRSSMEADLSSPGEQRSPSRSVLLLAPSEHRESVRFSVQHQLRPKNLRTYFMQVCRFYPGSTFGFGENMRDRRIIALTPVDCMLLPKMWLLQRNTANIWSRIQHFLEKKIPTKRQLFREFVSARRWQEFRDQLVGDIVARSKTVNLTSVHDVPYSIRMEEMLDI